MRMLILSENYGENVLVITDLENNELLEVLKQIENDIENGVGRCSYEVAESLFPNCVYRELLDTNLTICDELKELDTELIVDYSCYSFLKVK